MTLVVHSIVKDSNNKNSGTICLEENAVAARSGHLQAGSKIIARPAYSRAREQTLHRIAQRPHVLDGAFFTPGSRGVSTYRSQIRTSDVGEVEALHNSAKSASI
jgi:hypothetical protein